MLKLYFLRVTSFKKFFCHSKLDKDTIAEKIRLVEAKTDELIKHCQDELIRKKNSIIDNLNLTKVSLMQSINENPRLWRNEEFQFQLTTETQLVLKADVSNTKLQQQTDHIKYKKKLLIVRNI